jgi:hypothetical protein
MKENMSPFVVRSSTNSSSGSSSIGGGGNNFLFICVLTPSGDRIINEYERIWKVAVMTRSKVIAPFPKFG